MKLRYTFTLIAFCCVACVHPNVTPTGRLPSSDTDASPFEIIVKGSDAEHFLPKLDGPVIEDESQYDVVVVGGGLSGLSAAVFLTDAHLKVLLLEKESFLGGLAFGGTTRSGIKFDRGAAYWTDTYNEEQYILSRIGLGDFKKRFAITEPADSFLWNGKLYKGIWENATLADLPASFTIFRDLLVQANNRHLIGDQPIELGNSKLTSVRLRNLKLDGMSATEWIRSMPAQFKLQKTKLAIALYEKYLREHQGGSDEPMSEVLTLLNLYCRSALGSTCENVSALAFANFYISEIQTRYTTQTGTNGATKNMEEILFAKKELFHVKRRAVVGSIEDRGASGAVIRYEYEHGVHQVKAQYVVYAAQLKFAPMIIKDLTAKDPLKVAAIKGLKYSHYSVHDIFLKSHPFRSSYDTWVSNSESKPSDFTDFILGRWQDPKIQGYKNFRDFKNNPGDSQGIFTIYNPLPPEWNERAYSKEEAKGLAEDAIVNLQKVLSSLPQSELPNGFVPARDIEYVETNRWPFSVHIPQPGHFTKVAPLLRRRVGRIYFAHNNIGTPAFEEALFRGHCAADNILLKMNPQFKFESWPTKCPYEK